MNEQLQIYLATLNTVEFLRLFEEMRLRRIPHCEGHWRRLLSFESPHLILMVSFLTNRLVQYSIEEYSTVQYSIYIVQ